VSSVSYFPLELRRYDVGNGSRLVHTLHNTIQFDTFPLSSYGRFCLRTHDYLSSVMRGQGSAAFVRGLVSLPSRETATRMGLYTHSQFETVLQGNAREDLFRAKYPRRFFTSKVIRSSGRARV
jgi:hypothetical protein